MKGRLTPTLAQRVAPQKNSTKNQDLSPRERKMISKFTLVLTS